MFKKYLFLIAILSGFLFLGCSDSKKSDANDMISANQYVLTSLDKKEYVVKKEAQGFVLKGAEGKIVIFDIFATWCPPCRAAAPHLSSLLEKYKDDLVITGITKEDGIEDAKLQELANTYGAKYTLVNSAQNRSLTNALVKELELGDRLPIPTVAMYKDGKLINHDVGATEEEFIESDIRNALAK